MRTLAICLLVACGCAADPGLTAEIIDAAPRVLDSSTPGGRDLTVTVRYRDGNGDLGGGRARLHDCRGAALTTELALPPIASAAAVEAGVPIEGTLALTVRQVAPGPAAELPAVCRDAGVTLPRAGLTIFCADLEDQAGERSNTTCTATIAVQE